MAHFEGHYKLKSSENFDDFLSTLGVNPLLRHIGSYTKPTLAISVTNGNHFKIKQSATAFKKYDLEFDIGKVFDNKTIDGRMVKSCVMLDDDRLIQTDLPVNTDEKICTFIREIDEDNNLVMTCKVNNVVSVRVYQRTI
ncbi:fatty acid-binding protein, adipocyte-like [Asterias rubens]|uniref:fatty acid-binding protein, adipocyte-like n=1 Tax=Asterias rubens TaxID=7604 RepID=UPI001454E76B|nr:fatty acid-binding protein, adipocyte-like [Asterias rubens]